jgi:hypothetical protein
MNILWLFDTCGYIVGPAILAAGLVSILLCAWGTFRSTSLRTRRLAVALACSPIVLGVCGFLFGLVVCWREQLPDVPWLALAKVCLAGVVVASVPLLWALLLWRYRRPADPQAVSQ